MTFDDPEELIRQARATARDVVLDLPLSWLPERSLREAAALSVVVVGPGAMDDSGKLLPMEVAVGDCVLLSGGASPDEHQDTAPSSM